MAISGKQTIDIGLPNESTGSDSLFDAFTKTQQNFNVLFANSSPYNTFANGVGIETNTNSNTNTITITNTGVTYLQAGSGVTLSGNTGNVTISSTGGGGGSGTVTSVGLTPVSNTRITVTNSPITSSGNISIDLANSGVTPGNYTLADITVDEYGRVTNISNGVSIGSQITNGNSNVVVGANSNVTIGVNGTASALVVSSTGTTVTGNLVATNLSGTLLTGTLTTAAQPNITSLGSLTTLIVDGDINAYNLTGNHYGDGTGLTNIPGANVTGNVASANIAYGVSGANVTGAVSYATTANSVAGANVTGTVSSATSAGSATTAGTVTTAAQPNITSLGTLTSLIVSGNVNAANVSGANTMTANYFIGSGNNLSNIQAANISGTVANANYSVSAGSATNATNATYAASAGYTNSSAVAATATKAGTVTTNAQPNITSVGTLTSLIVSGNVNAGNVILSAVNKLKVAGGSAGYILQTDGASNLSWVAQSGSGNGSPGGANTEVQFNNSGLFGGNSTFTFDTATGILSAPIYQGNGTNLTNIAGANVTGEVAYATTANSVAGANVSGQVANTLIAGTVYTNAQPNITSLGTLTALTINGNANLGNVAIANYFSGDGSNLTNLPAPSITEDTTNADNFVMITDGNLKYTGHVTIQPLSGNITTLGNISAGNVIADNFVGNVANTTLSASSNVILSAGTSVQVTGGGVFRLSSLTSTQIANLSATNGDMVYNSTLNKFQGFENGAWANLI